MKILFLSFYYSPDIGPGAFRATQLISALLDQLPKGAHIEVITTCPNRYNSYRPDAPEVEELPGLTIRRIKMPMHRSGIIDQMWAFSTYAFQVLRLVRHSEYQLVYGTSARLMTAVLSAYLARRYKAPLYLDIRDIFVETIRELFQKRFVPLPVWFFSLVERWTIGRATKINLVSRGFEDYFQTRYPGQAFSYFTNGIGSEFIEDQNNGECRIVSGEKSILTVLYAGNIGEGQGLHKIIPELAKRLGGRIRFLVIGDGARRFQLEQKLFEMGCKNVELIPPLGRIQLLAEYQRADILFVHLNDFDVLRKVLPSKLFEYAAMGKPIWAGVSGHAAEFIKTKIENATIFEPCNVDGAVRALEDLDLDYRDRGNFVEIYSGKTVFPKMATDIFALMKNESVM